MISNACMTFTQHRNIMCHILSLQLFAECRGWSRWLVIATCYSTAGTAPRYEQT